MLSSRAIQRPLSLLLAAAYALYVITAAVKTYKSTAAAAVNSSESIIIILIPVALIWFPNQLAAATGYLGHGNINAESPPALLAFMGWLFLLALPCAVYFLSR